MISKRALRSPWAPQGFHKREGAVQTHFGHAFCQFWLSFGFPLAFPVRALGSQEEHKRVQKRKMARDGGAQDKVSEGRDSRHDFLQILAPTCLAGTFEN